MKKKSLLMLFLAVCILLLEGCAPKPQYQTRSGKKKLKKYNSIQYQAPQPKP